MPGPLHPTAARVQERLAALGLEVDVVVLPGSTRTAADAAAACGCELGQIVKSLVFVEAASDEPVMCLWAGDRQVPADELGLRRASADVVREVTGFAVGGVPPLGHERPLRTIVDDSLDRFDRVWCAAGTPHAVFEVSLAELRRALDATRSTR
ncbi:MAG: YbaK/EbsC family protein [Thermoleophilia bacterium]|nr:YbaK/EbsC family protein [Thermoleophilia bacterium]MDH4345365.1 YbaK/EbsC family protein [Thermoleophilia bacterium]MDH5334629.1 YbaK/EbsC family protein [Thermoleophilia bacterium]